MTIRHLRIFEKVCEAGGVTRAAGQLYMTQPAVSHAIAELEQELGLPLFDRVGRRLCLNGAGRLFLQKAQRLLELYRELEHSGELLGKLAPLRIGSSITLANYLLPALLRRFEQACDTPTCVTVDNAASIAAQLRRGELDLALVEGVVADDGLEKRMLPPFALAVVCAPSHPFAGRSITVAQLVADRLLLREKGSAIRDTFDSALLLHQAVAEPCWCSVNSQALLQAARQGLGVAVLPALLAEEAVRQGQVAPVEVQGLALPCACQVIYQKEKYQTEPFRLLLDLLEAPGDCQGG